MAIGDDAAAAGMDIVPGSTPANEIDTEINKTRDYLAQRTALVTPVARGGTGADNPGQARTNLGAAAATHTHRITDIYTADGSQQYAVALQATLDTKASTAQLQSVYDGVLSAAIYSRTLGVRRSCYVQTDGVLGYDGSSERFKVDIRPYVAPWSDIVTGLEIKEYDRIEDGSHEVGLIAEDLDALGMGWAVLYDDDGQPEGIAYERAWLALVPVVQDLMARVAALEAHDA